jgi:hypothetical protein
VALGNADCADLWIVPTSSWESSAEQTLRSARSAQSGRPPGFDTKWMALRVPAWGRNVMCQCFHPSPTTRRSGQQDGVLRARPGLAAQLRRATRTGLCQRRRYESPCCAADAATRVGIIGRCGDVGKRRIWSDGEDRCSSVARSGGPGCHRRSGARSTAVEYGRAARPRCRLINVPCGHHRSCDGVSSEL